MRSLTIQEEAQARYVWKTPAQIAEEWGVEVKFVREEIRAGRLRAINLTKSKVRPTYRVKPKWVVEYEERMEVGAA